VGSAATRAEESDINMIASQLSPFVPDGHTLTALLIVICFCAGLNAFGDERPHGLAIPLDRASPLRTINNAAVRFLVYSPHPGRLA
jgi:hypothetical protein